MSDLDKEKIFMKSSTNRVSVNWSKLVFYYKLNKRFFLYKIIDKLIRFLLMLGDLPDDLKDFPEHMVSAIFIKQKIGLDGKSVKILLWLLF